MLATNQIAVKINNTQNNSLLTWAKNTIDAINKLSIDEESQDKINALRQAMTAIINEQLQLGQNQLVQQKLIAQLRAQINSAQQAEELTDIKKKIESLEKEITVKSSPEYKDTLTGHLKSIQADFVLQKKVLESTSKPQSQLRQQLQSIIDQHGETIKQFDQWQKEYHEHQISEQKNYQAQLSEWQANLMQIKLSIAKQIAILEKKVSGLEQWANKVNEQLQGMQTGNEETDVKIKALQENLAKVIKEQFATQQQQQVYQKQLITLKTQLASTSGQDTVTLETKIISLESSLKQLSEDKNSGEIKKQFDELKRDLEVTKKVLLATVARCTGASKQQLQSVIDEQDKHIKTITEWQQGFQQQIIQQQKEQSQHLAQLQTDVTDHKRKMSLALKTIWNRLEKLEHVQVKEAITEIKIQFNREEFVKQLHEQYSAQSYITPLFSEAKIPIAESYINLAIVNEEFLKPAEGKTEEANIHSEITNNNYAHSKKEIIQIEKLFDKISSNEKHVNILGRAGIGKSTFCKYASSQWAVGKLWNQFEILFWISLRNLNKDRYPENKEYKIADIIAMECLGQATMPEWAREGFNQMINNPNVLWLLDGHDEIAGRLPTHLTSIFQQLLDQPSRLLTSRPQQMAHISANAKLEIIGFTDDNVKNYINYHFSESKQVSSAPKAISLFSFLQAHPVVWGIAHTPVNLTLICHIWEQKLLDETISMTALYQEIHSWLMRRYLTKSSSQLSKEEIKLTTDTLLTALELLAFTNTQQESLIISNEILENILTQISQNNKIDLLKVLLDSGIVKKSDDSYKELKSSFYFIHLTFQEFYAAKYISNQIISYELSKPIQSFIEKNKYISRFEIVWSFIAGLLAQHALTTKDASAMNHFFDMLISEPYDLYGMYDFNIFIRCLEEAYPAFDLLNDHLKQLILTWLSNYLKGVGFAQPNLAHNIIELLPYTPNIAKKIQPDYLFVEFLSIAKSPLRRSIYDAITKLQLTSHDIIKTVITDIKAGCVYALEAGTKLLIFNQELLTTCIDAILKYNILDIQIRNQMVDNLVQGINNQLIDNLLLSINQIPKKYDVQKELTSLTIYRPDFVNFVAFYELANMIAKNWLITLTQSLSAKVSTQYMNMIDAQAKKVSYLAISCQPEIIKLLIEKNLDSSNFSNLLNVVNPISKPTIKLLETKQSENQLVSIVQTEKDLMKLKLNDLSTSPTTYNKLANKNTEGKLPNPEDSEIEKSEKKEFKAIVLELNEILPTLDSCSILNEEKLTLIENILSTVAKRTISPEEAVSAKDTIMVCIKTIIRLNRNMENAANAFILLTEIINDISLKLEFNQQSIEFLKKMIGLCDSMWSERSYGPRDYYSFGYTALVAIKKSLILDKQLIAWIKENASTGYAFNVYNALHPNDLDIQQLAIKNLEKTKLISYSFEALIILETINSLLENQINQHVISKIKDFILVILKECLEYNQSGGDHDCVHRKWNSVTRVGSLFELSLKQLIKIIMVFQYRDEQFPTQFYQMINNGRSSKVNIVNSFFNTIEINMELVKIKQQKLGIDNEVPQLEKLFSNSTKNVFNTHLLELFFDISVANVMDYKKIDLLLTYSSKVSGQNILNAINSILMGALKGIEVSEYLEKTYFSSSSQTIGQLFSKAGKVKPLIFNKNSLPQHVITAMIQADRLIDPPELWVGWLEKNYQTLETDKVILVLKKITPIKQFGIKLIDLMLSDQKRTLSKNDLKSLIDLIDVLPASTCKIIEERCKHSYYLSSNDEPLVYRLIKQKPELINELISKCFDIDMIGELIGIIDKNIHIFSNESYQFLFKTHQEYFYNDGDYSYHYKTRKIMRFIVTHKPELFTNSDIEKMIEWLSKAKVKIYDNSFYNSLTDCLILVEKRKIGFNPIILNFKLLLDLVIKYSDEDINILNEIIKNEYASSIYSEKILLSVLETISKLDSKQKKNLEESLENIKKENNNFSSPQYYSYVKLILFCLDELLKLNKLSANVELLLAKIANEYVNHLVFIKPILKIGEKISFIDSSWLKVLTKLLSQYQSNEQVIISVTSQLVQQINQSQALPSECHEAVNMLMILVRVYTKNNRIRILNNLLSKMIAIKPNYLSNLEPINQLLEHSSASISKWGSEFFKKTHTYTIPFLNTIDNPLEMVKLYQEAIEHFGKLPDILLNPNFLIYASNRYPIYFIGNNLYLTLGNMNYQQEVSVQQKKIILDKFISKLPSGAQPFQMVLNETSLNQNKLFVLPKKNISNIQVVQSDLLIDYLKELPLSQLLIQQVQCLILLGYSPTKSKVSRQNMLHLALLANHRRCANHFTKINNLDLFTKEDVLKFISYLLKELEINVNEPDEQGRTSLHYASKYGDVDILKLLIDAGGDLNLTDGEDYLPLDIVVMEKKLIETRFLLPQSKLQSHHKVLGKYNLLTMNKLVELAGLVEQKFGVNKKGISGKNLLHYEVISYTSAIIRAIKEKIDTEYTNKEKKNISDDYLSTIPRQQWWSARYDYYKFVKSEIDISQNSQSDLNIIKYLIQEEKLDINATDNVQQTVLHYAAKDGDSKICQFLLALGADSNKNDLFGNIPLDYALQRLKSEVNDSGLAEQKNDIQVIETFITATTAAGRYIHIKSPLAQACLKKDPALIKYYLSKSQPLDFTDHRGNNCLMIAINYKFFDIANSLIKKINLDHQNYLGQTALMLAAKMGNSDLLTTLITLVKTLTTTDKNDQHFLFYLDEGLRKTIFDKISGLNTLCGQTNRFGRLPLKFEEYSDELAIKLIKEKKLTLTSRDLTGKVLFKMLNPTVRYGESFDFEYNMRYLAWLKALTEASSKTSIKGKEIWELLSDLWIEAYDAKDESDSEFESECNEDNLNDKEEKSVKKDSQKHELVAHYIDEIYNLLQIGIKNSLTPPNIMEYWKMCAKSKDQALTIIREIIKRHKALKTIDKELTSTINALIEDVYHELTYEPTRYYRENSDEDHQKSPVDVTSKPIFIIFIECIKLFITEGGILIPLTSRSAEKFSKLFILLGSHSVSELFLKQLELELEKALNVLLVNHKVDFSTLLKLISTEQKAEIIKVCYRSLSDSYSKSLLNYLLTPKMALYIYSKNKNLPLYDLDKNNPLHTAINQLFLFPVKNDFKHKNNFINKKNYSWRSREKEKNEMIYAYRYLFDNYSEANKLLIGQIEELCNYPQLIDEQNKYGETPLMLAVKKRCLPIVKKLISMKANVYLKDRYGHTVLQQFENLFKDKISGDVQSYQSILQDIYNCITSNEDGSNLLEKDFEYKVAQSNNLLKRPEEKSSEISFEAKLTNVPGYSFFKENRSLASSNAFLQQEEKTHYTTLDDGNCFFHACFGEPVKEKYLAPNATILRSEWVKLLSKFSSLNDITMPASLKNFLESILQTIFDNPHQNGIANNKELLNLLLTVKSKINQAETECKSLVSNIKNKILQGNNQVKAILSELINLIEKSSHPTSQEIIKMLVSKTRQINPILTEVNLLENHQTFLQIATKDITYLDNIILNNINRFAIAYDSNNYPNEKKFNEKLNTRSILKEFLYNKTIYQVYLEAISRNSYYIYTEEIPILASLSGTKIHLWYKDKDGKCHEQVFAPDTELVQWIDTHFQKTINTPWNKMNEVHIYHEGFDEKGNPSLSLHYSRTNLEAFKLGFSHNTSSQIKKRIINVSY